MRKKIIIYSLVFSILVLAASCSAYFFISWSKDISDSLKKVIRDGKYKIALPQNEAVYLKDFSRIREELVLAASDFLEANLSQMKVYFYKAGVLEKEFPILVKGDPQGWGGSAAGLYRVISGNKNSYSIAAEVYMPYALRYYGKYYVHGEPYYAGGIKRFTDATGGCIQLSDNDAKAVFNLAEIDMPLLVIDQENDGYQYSVKKTKPFPQVSAQNYLIADLDSGFIFAEKKSKEQWPTASLAKLMTAVVAAENIDLRKSIRITPEMLLGFGSTEGLVAGKSFRVVELFYPLLISSSNDAAQALSYFLTWDKTVELMNEKAKAILMENTEFVSPAGFSEKNVSTAQDLFYLARYVLNSRPPLWQITKNEKVQAFGEVRFKSLDNKNLFFEDQNFIGGKTGYIASARHNGVFLFRFPAKNNSERRIAIILLSSAKLDGVSGSLKNDVEKIIEWLKVNYFSPSETDIANRF